MVEKLWCRGRGLPKSTVLRYTPSLYIRAYILYCTNHNRVVSVGDGLCMLMTPTSIIRKRDDSHWQARRDVPSFFLYLSRACKRPHAKECAGIHCKPLTLFCRTSQPDFGFRQARGKRFAEPAVCLASLAFQAPLQYMFPSTFKCFQVRTTHRWNNMKGNGADNCSIQ